MSIDDSFEPSRFLNFTEFGGLLDLIDFEESDLMKKVGDYLDCLNFSGLVLELEETKKMFDKNPETYVEIEYQSRTYVLKAEKYLLFVEQKIENLEED